jgi:hypothetical protein
MGTARLMTMMGIVAIGAGVFLAVATIPAMAPYRQERPERAAMRAPLPQALAPPAPGPAYGLLPGAENSPDDDFHIGSRDGAWVVEVPRWTEDGGAWLALGRHAWQDWVEPGDDEAGGDARDDEPRYARPDRRRWDDRGYGYEVPRSARRWSDDGSDRSDDEADDERWNDMGEPPLPPVYGDAPDARRFEQRQDTTEADAAARAADRARDAARDVRAAEGAAG